MEPRSVSKMDLPKEPQKELLLADRFESQKVSQLDQWSEHHSGSELATLLVSQKELLLVDQLDSCLFYQFGDVEDAPFVRVSYQLLVALK